MRIEEQSIEDSRIMIASQVGYIKPNKPFCTGVIRRGRLTDRPDSALQYLMRPEMLRHQPTNLHRRIRSLKEVDVQWGTSDSAILVQMVSVPAPAGWIKRVYLSGCTRLRCDLLVHDLGFERIAVNASI